MRSDIDFEDIYKLRTTQTNSQESSIDVYYASEVGIGVWQRASAGVENEITAGYPVALVYMSDVTESRELWNTWTAPEYPLNPTDRIVVRVYDSFNNTLASFVTEELGASKLNAETWTVYYYFELFFDGEYYYIYWCWGANTCNSRIEGFSYTRT